MMELLELQYLNHSPEVFCKYKPSKNRSKLYHKSRSNNHHGQWSCLSAQPNSSSGAMDLMHCIASHRQNGTIEELNELLRRKSVSVLLNTCAMETYGNPCLAYAVCVFSGCWHHGKLLQFSGTENCHLCQRLTSDPQPAVLASTAERPRQLPMTFAFPKELPALSEALGTSGSPEMLKVLL